MKTLLLLRHAKSSWGDPSLDDHDRPLNERGQLAAPRMGQLLVAEGLVPDLVLASTAVRAQETARLLLGQCPGRVELQSERNLYLAPPSVYLALAQRLAPTVTRVLMIGHNPGIEELVSELCGRSEHLPTAALGAFELEVGAWTEVDRDVPARELGLWRPRELS